MDSARAIRSYLAGVSREQFEANSEKQDAVIRRYAVMGEAARHLSPAILKALGDLPWRQITGMRNILVHDYDDVDEATLWDTAQNDLPALILRLEAHLAQEPPPGPP
ncbi:MAG: HepT-like ribonuclease domain-containing protein [Limisphaerales bacterium]